MNSKQEFINYLKETLIPGLVEDGMTLTANDFREAIHWMEYEEVPTTMEQLKTGIAPLTVKETAMMEIIANDDHVSDHGWKSSSAMFWTNGMLCNDDVKRTGIQKRSVPGIMASLVKKDMIRTDGDSGILTDKGRWWLSVNQNELDIPKY